MHEDILTASNTRSGILTDARVEDGVGDLVADLIGVALIDGLRSEQESLRHCY